jgi:hypothetical protein
MGRLPTRRLRGPTLLVHTVGGEPPEYLQVFVLAGDRERRAGRVAAGLRSGRGLTRTKPKTLSS